MLSRILADTSRHSVADIPIPGKTSLDSAVTSRAAAIVAARRTPIGSAGHALASSTAAELAAAAIGAVIADLRAIDLDAAAAADVVLGNCMGPGGNLARVAALSAGLPVSVPGLTVDRQCGSGLAAVALGDSLIGTAAKRALVLAGGVESASTAPWRYWPPDRKRPPERYLRAPFAPAELGDPEMGPAADLVAADAGIGRERQDGYAARSHALAVEAQARGAFEAELVPVTGVAVDERPRAGLTVERLARFPPAFASDGTVTAGNSCGVSDGAAVVALLADDERRRLGLPGLRILCTATAGLDPRHPGPV